MSLNDIQLKSSLLADLYKDSLIEIVTTSLPEPRQLKYLGNNQKKIIIIVSHDKVPFLPDEELSFLTNVLAACKLGMADVGIINKHGVQEGDLQNTISSEAKQVLLFGVYPPDISLPINFPPFQTQPFNNRTYLHAPPLLQIENDKILKARLWGALKVLFRI